jgi:hypothetical protein
LGYFSAKSSADTDAPFAAVHPLSKGVGDLFFGDGSDDPLELSWNRERSASSNFAP